MGGVIVAVLSFVLLIFLFANLVLYPRLALNIWVILPDLIHPRAGILDTSHYSGSVVVLS